MTRREETSDRLYRLYKISRDIENDMMYNSCNDDFGRRHKALEDEILNLYLEIRNTGYEWHLAMSDQEL